MSKKVVAPARTIAGAVTFPGDKSISHRYAILAALATGPSEIRNYSSAADCRSTLDCLRRLGVQAEIHGNVARIEGVGLHGLKASRRSLDAGNSGTSMRLLAGVLAGQTFSSKLTGDDSLRRRPMRRVFEPLRRMGAEIQAHDGDYAPFEIRGGALKAIEYETPVPSAQVKSAILLAGLYAEGWTTVREAVRTRDHLEVALREFGAETRRAEGAAGVRGGARLEGRGIEVPGDLSAAIFFIGAAVVLPGSSVLLHDVGLNPTRTAVLDLLISMGAQLHLASVRMRDGELVGDLAVRHAPLAGGTISGDAVALMIDELPMLAALGPYTEEGIEIRNARELRVKESDRIAALAEGLRGMGAQVEEFEDGLRVAGRAAGKLHGAKLDPRGDHRIAMALSVAALGAEGASVLRDAGCVGISFPEFFPLLEQVLER